MTAEWMKKLSKEDNNKDFSELCHSYFKLAVMRVMQQMREKYTVPPNDMHKLLTAIWGRFMNEAVYAIGACIHNGVPMKEIFDKGHLSNLFSVLMGNSLDIRNRKDIDMSFEAIQEKFKKFIIENGGSFYE